jgi:hypothetical protein
MKKSSYVLIGIILSYLLIQTQSAHAVVNPYLDPVQRTTNLSIATPTLTPVPTKIDIQLKPGLNKLPLVTLGAKNTVTPTATITNTPTPTASAATPTATETVAPLEKNDSTASDAATTPSPTPAPTGIQTKDVVTYGLIGAIVIVLLTQAFGKKKDDKPEEKKE